MGEAEQDFIEYGLQCTQDVIEKRICTTKIMAVEGFLFVKNGMEMKDLKTFANGQLITDTLTN